MSVHSHVVLLHRTWMMTDVEAMFSDDEQLIVGPLLLYTTDTSRESVRSQNMQWVHGIVRKGQLIKPQLSFSHTLTIWYPSLVRIQMNFELFHLHIYISNWDLCNEAIFANVKFLQYNVVTKNQLREKILNLFVQIKKNNYWHYIFI